MKKYLKTLLFLILFANFCSFLKAEYVPLWIDKNIKKNISHNKRYYFAINDYHDDDKGPGTYVYPTNQIYTDGSFDLTRFVVEDKGRKIWFRFKFRAPIISRKVGFVGYNGWILQMIDVYIDTDQKEGSGFVDALPGRRIKFTPQSAWDKMILITPENPITLSDDIKNKTDNILFTQMAPHIIVPQMYKVKNREIIAIVDKSELGIPTKDWGYQVAILGFYSGDSPNSRTSFDQVLNPRPENPMTSPLYTRIEKVDWFKNLEVLAYAGNHNFGGGSDYDGDPNVIDIITPPNVNQYEVLSNYSSYPNPSMNKLAVVSCVYQRKKTTKRKLKITFKNYTKILEDLEKKKEQLDRLSNLAEKIKKFEKEKAKFSSQNVGKEKKTVELTDKEKCHLNQKMIYEAAVKYHRAHPEDKNITILDLLYGGYLKKEPVCPTGGKYAIYGESEGQLKVRCFNPNGIEHGYYDGKKFHD